VHEIFWYCLFRKEEGETGFTSVSGVLKNASFHKGRLAERKEAIHTLLKELPASLQEIGGGGASFLEIAEDRDGKVWTRNFLLMEQLLLLGLAIGKIEYTHKRRFWDILPYGIPHIVVKKVTE
jgi:hypothetical protein